MISIQVIILWFSIIPFLTFAVNQPDVEFLSYRHEYSRDYVKFTNLKLINDTKRLVLNGSVIYQRDLYQFDFRLKISAAQTIRSKNWNVLDISTDICSVLENASQRSYNLIHKVIVDVKSFGNLLPKKCPFLKDYEYSVRNFFLTWNNFPIRLPNVLLNVLIHFYDNTTSIYRGIFEIKLPSKGSNAQKKDM